MGLARFCLFQAEDGIRYLVRSRGLGDVYKRQVLQRGDGRSLGLQQLRDVLRRHRGHRLLGEYLLCLSLIHI